MNYIIFDLEWNQRTVKKEEKASSLPFEIIEIGAVKMDEKRCQIDTFHRLIKPTIYPALNDKTKEITGLTEEKLQRGVRFLEAVGEFLRWCGEDYRFATWGDMDLFELQRNLKFFQSSYHFQSPLYYYDVQKLYNIAFEEEDMARTLEYAVSELKISIGEKKAFHNALNDAQYTAEIFAKINPHLIKINFSVDVFSYPKNRKEEIELAYPDHSLYISRAFPTKTEVKMEKRIVSLNCFLCARKSKKIVGWYAGSQKNYYALGYCKQHGYLKGKLLIKNPETSVYFGMKTIYLITEEEAKQMEQRYYLKKQDEKEKPV